jgi:hypothetical protein
MDRTSVRAFLWCAEESSKIGLFSSKMTDSNMGDMAMEIQTWHLNRQESQRLFSVELFEKFSGKQASAAEQVAQALEMIRVYDKEQEIAQRTEIPWKVLGTRNVEELNRQFKLECERSVVFHAYEQKKRDARSTIEKIETQERMREHKRKFGEF